jgi:uncharacterized protein (TIGR02246 family)
MRRFVAFTALPVALTALMFMAPLAACQAPAPEAAPLSEEDVAAIKASTDSFVEALLAGDWAAFAALYTEDAVVMPPNVPVVEGRVDLQAFLEPLSRFTQVELTIVQIDGRGDLAFVRATYSETYSVEGTPEPIHNTGNSVTIWRKQADGKWLIALDISNFDLPLPE